MRSNDESVYVLDCDPVSTNRDVTLQIGAVVMCSFRRQREAEDVTQDIDDVRLASWNELSLEVRNALNQAI